MDDSSDMLSVIKNPNGGLGKEIKNAWNEGKTFLLTVVSAIGKEKVVKIRFY